VIPATVDRPDEGAGFLDYIDNTGISWHGTRWMDFGFLQEILRDGFPASSKDGMYWQTCLSSSPLKSIRDGHQIDSFMSYSMNSSRFSVAVRTNEIGRPDPHWFDDEYIAHKPIPSERIVAVAVNDRTRDSPLSEARVDQFAINFERQFEYLERSIDWAGSICGPVIADKLRQQFLLSSRSAGLHLRRYTSMEVAYMQKTILSHVASHMREELGREPTVGDVLDRVLAGSSATLLVWNDQTRHALEGIQSRLPNDMANMRHVPSLRALIPDPPRQRPPSPQHSEQVPSSPPGGGVPQPGTTHAEAVPRNTTSRATRAIRNAARTAAAPLAAKLVSLAPLARRTRHPPGRSGHPRTGSPEARHPAPRSPASSPPGPAR